MIGVVDYGGANHASVVNAVDNLGFDYFISDNQKSLAYYSIGGNNCDDSYLFSVANKVNEVIDMKKITEPIIHSVQIGSGLIYTNRKIIRDVSEFVSIISGVSFTMYMMLASP